MNDSNKFIMEFDWQDPGGAQGPELRATWASLSISINGRPVTEILDGRTRSVRNSLFLPLFPLVEWIADNWWFLIAEVENSGEPRNGEFDRRHNFRWAREGFALPSLRFVPLGDHIAAEWQPMEIQGAEIRFLSQGSEILPARLVMDRMRDFVNAVLGRLEASGLSETTLHEQWTAIENADAEEQEFCRAAARLGADPYAVDKQLEAVILAVAKTIRADLLGDFLSLADALRLSDQADSLKSASDSIAADTGAVDGLAAVRDHAPRLSEGATPWETGYRFAEKLRRALNHSAWTSRSLDDLAGHLKIDQLEHCLMAKAVTSVSLDALVGANQCNNPKFIIEKSRPDSRQFAFCRALFEHLTLPRGRFAAVSRLRTDRQQMNRAFAAEFLAPHAMLKSDLSGATIGEEEIEELAVDYGVSAFVIRHQIENHGLATVSC